MIQVDWLASTLTEFVAKKAEKSYVTEMKIAKYTPSPPFKFNKRREIEALLRGDNANGHDWQMGSQNTANLSAKCKKSTVIFFFVRPFCVHTSIRYEHICREIFQSLRKYMAIHQRISNCTPQKFNNQLRAHQQHTHSFSKSGVS